MFVKLRSKFMKTKDIKITTQLKKNKFWLCYLGTMAEKEELVQRAKLAEQAERYNFTHFKISWELKFMIYSNSLLHMKVYAKAYWKI